MNGMKIQLLGIAVILFGIAFSMQNFFGYLGGAAGLIITLIGCFVSNSR